MNLVQGSKESVFAEQPAFIADSKKDNTNGDLPRTVSLTPIKEAATLPPDHRKDGKNQPDHGVNPTYREKLGGYLHPRDMRKLVTPFSASHEPELIVRRHAMLLNFDTLRAIILRDRVLVLVPDGADSVLVELEKRIRGDADLNDRSYGTAPSQNESDEDPSASAKVKTSRRESELSKDTTEGTEDVRDSFVETEWEEFKRKDWIDLPFELKSVDAVLISVCAVLADDILDLQLGANSVVSDLLSTRSDLGDQAQRDLRNMKNAIKEMTGRVQGFCRALDVVLEDYEDMALMNLSRLLTHRHRFIQPVPQAVLEEESDEPELILEAHLQRGNTLTNALSLIAGQIGTTEDFLTRKSDLIRNRLLYINMMIAVMTLGMAGATFIAGIFGMNVPIPHTADPTAFPYIVGLSLSGALVFILIVLLFLKSYF